MGMFREKSMKRAVLYIHGKDGNAGEAKHYQPLFPDCDVIGVDYAAQTPWAAKAEFAKIFDAIAETYASVTIIANSIGAYFTMHALKDRPIERVYFISPVVDMEHLITDMMQWANVTEDELRDKKVIETAFGETLSWDYLCYVRQHPIVWKISTRILYGGNDNLTSYETMAQFADRIGASLTVMENGEHWFHTQEQMRFLDNWIRG